MTIRNLINVGTAANDGTGDQPRTAFMKLALPYSKTYVANQAQFGGATAEAIITNTISAAFTDGATAVLVPNRDTTATPPLTLLPYNASLVTFNNAVRMIAEGYNPSEFNVRAYGAAGDGVTNDQTAIQAAINAAQAVSTNALRGGIVKFPAGKYVHTATIQIQNTDFGQSLLVGPVVLRGDGMRNTYLYPSGPSTNFTAAPLYNVCLLFGPLTPDAAGVSTNQTFYCGLEDMSTSGTLITSGSVVAVQFTEMQKGWIRNHICELFPNSSIGLYLRGSTVTGGLGASAAPHCWRCVFENCSIVTGSGTNTTPLGVLLQNADENSFVNCVHGITAGLTLNADSVYATWIKMGRNNIFVDCLQSGDRTALKTGYVGMAFGPPTNEAGAANGGVIGNVDYGAVMEGFDICAWNKADGTGNTIGNAVLNSNPSIFTTAFKDDVQPLLAGAGIGGGSGGFVYEAPLLNIMYGALPGRASPAGVFADGATTPTIGGTDTWQTANSGATIITDFLVTAGSSNEGRLITIRVNDANTTIRDQNNGGGGSIRTWGRQDIVASVAGLVVSFRRSAGIWLQEGPHATASNAGTAALRMPVSLVERFVSATEADLVSGIGTLGNSGNYYKVTLTAARLVGAPLNPFAGQRITFTFVQSGAGGFAVTWNAVFVTSWSDTGNATPKRSTISYRYDGVSWNQDGAQTPFV